MRDMENFWAIVVAAIGAVIALFPVVMALVLATFAAKLFSKLFTPVTRPIEAALEQVCDRIHNPLEDIPMFDVILEYFGSTKNILFMGFVSIFLIFHYKTLGNVGNIFENISLLFPGSALDQFVSYGAYDGKLNISSFLVKPELYLQTLIYSGVTGLFMHIGCTTKVEGARVHILVKLLYTMLITLFSAIVLGKLPAELFSVSLPKISLDIASVGSIAAESDALQLLGQLWDWFAILLEKFISLVPGIVAFYFLCESITGFSASFLGGFMAMFSLAMACPDVFTDSDSSRAVFLLLATLSIGEVVSLIFSEFVSKGADLCFGEHEKIFEYYNIVSLLLAYFFYPLVAVVVLCVISFFSNGFHFGLLLVSVGCILVFSLVTYAGYKIKQWVWPDSGIDGMEFACSMVFNLPIWVIYLVLF